MFSCMFKLGVLCDLLRHLRYVFYWSYYLKYCECLYQTLILCIGLISVNRVLIDSAWHYGEATQPIRACTPVPLICFKLNVVTLLLCLMI